MQLPEVSKDIMKGNRGKLHMKSLVEDVFERAMMDNAYFLSTYFGNRFRDLGKYTSILFSGDSYFSKVKDEIIVCEYGNVTDPLYGYPSWLGSEFTTHTSEDRLSKADRQRIETATTGKLQSDQGYLDHQKLLVCFRTEFIDQVKNLPLDYTLLGGMFLKGVSSVGSGHENIFVLIKLSDKIVIKRFEPYYSSQRHYAGISSLINTDPDDHVNQAIRDTLAKETGMPVEYERGFTGCPNLGFQSEEESIPRSSEEVLGYCLRWSLSVLEKIVNIYTSKTMLSTDLLSTAIAEVDKDINAEPGSTYPERARSFIRKTSSKFEYVMLKSDALNQIFDLKIGWMFLRFIHNTVPYFHASEIIMRKITEVCGSGSRRLSVSPIQIKIQSWPLDEFRRIAPESLVSIIDNPAIPYIVGGLGFMTGYYEFYHKRGSTVYEILIDSNTLTKPARVRTGLLIMKDNTPGGMHMRKDIEHINTVILRYDESGNRFLLNRFEPQFNVSTTDPDSMINIQGNSIWTTLIVDILSHVYTTSFPWKNLSVVYEPIVNNSCPNIGDVGPQYLEYFYPREAGEHIGYCQTWSFSFLDAYLTKLCIDPGYVLNTQELIDQMYQDAGVVQTDDALGVRQKLRTYIQTRSSLYCKLLFDEIYVPYFKSRDPSSQGTDWIDKWRVNLEDM
jgi:hypothetical protein